MAGVEQNATRNVFNYLIMFAVAEEEEEKERRERTSFAVLRP